MIQTRKLIAPHEADCGPGRDDRADRAVGPALGHVRGQRGDDAKGEQPAGQGGDGEPVPRGIEVDHRFSWGAKPTIRIFSFFVQVSGSPMRGKSAAGAARLRGAVALAALAGDRGWQGCRSAAAAPPQQVCRNRSWRLDEALSVQSGVKQGVQEGGQLAVCRAYPDPDAVGIVVW